MERIIGAMATPDGYWRVLVIRDGRDRWYRILHGTTIVHDKAPIAVVERVLGDQYSSLEPVDVNPDVA